MGKAERRRRRIVIHINATLLCEKLHTVINYYKLDTTCDLYTFFSGGPMIATRNGLNRSLHVGTFNYFIFFYTLLLLYVVW